MKYTLVKPDGTLGVTQDFTGAPPVLAQNKGKWLPDNPPALNPAAYVRERGLQSVNAAEIAYLVTARPLDQVKNEKLASLQQSRDAATVVDVTVQGKSFSAEPSVQTAFKRLADRMRRGRPTTLQAVLGVDGNPVAPVTQALLDGIEDAIAANTEAAWNKYGELVGQVNAATTVEQLEAIVW